MKNQNKKYKKVKIDWWYWYPIRVASQREFNEIIPPKGKKNTKLMRKLVKLTEKLTSFEESLKLYWWYTVKVAAQREIRKKID